MSIALRSTAAASSVPSRSRSWFAERIDRGAVLAPMAGFSDAPFRRLARHFGAAWAVSEMVSAYGLAHSAQDERGLRISAPYQGEPFVVVQLFAADPVLAARAVQRLERRYRPDAFDLNLGCPVKKVVHRGCGSELLREPAKAAAVLAAMASAASVPVSAKLRLGVDRDVSLEVAQALVEAGAAALAVHGRTAAQRYEGRADWDAIARVAAAVRVPVLGSGDVSDAVAYRQARSMGAGVMVARASVGRPWLFAEVLGAPAPTRDQLLTVIWRHARDHVAWYQGERPLRSLRGHLAAYARALAALREISADAVSLRAAFVRVDTLADLVDACRSQLGVDVRRSHEGLDGAWRGLADAEATRPRTGAG